MTDKSKRRIAEALIAPQLLKEMEAAVGVPAAKLGLPPNASVVAYHHAVRGYFAEKLDKAEKELQHLKPSRGRPKKPKNTDIDCQRATMLFVIARLLGSQADEMAAKPDKPLEITARVLIDLARLIVPNLFPKHLSNTRLEQSVSLGRKKLGIDKRWVIKNL